jgi:hypothetical protein
MILSPNSSRPLPRTFHTDRFPAPYPDLHNVTKITVPGWHSNGNNDNEALIRADNLVTLNVGDCEGGFRLPGEFPALQHLSLQGRAGREFLVGFSAPRLHTLTLSFINPCRFMAITNCKGINFKNIVELKLGWWFTLRREDMGQFVPEVGTIEAAANI